jgi:hypothetical protein
VASQGQGNTIIRCNKKALGILKFGLESKMMNEALATCETLFRWWESQNNVLCTVRRVQVGSNRLLEKALEFFTHPNMF